MDLSAIIVVALCILVFVGGAAWLGIHSRRGKRPDRQGVQPQQPDELTTSARRAVNRSVATGE